MVSAATSIAKEAVNFGINQTPGASVVVTRDSAYWAGRTFPKQSVPLAYNLNGDFWVIDNSHKSKGFLEKIWGWRDTVHELNDPLCVTK